MNKSDIVARVADRTSLSRAQAQDALDAVLEVIRDGLSNGDTITLIGFGTFSTKSRAARTGRNPSTGQRLAIAASKTPSFKAGKSLRDAVGSR